MLADLVAVLAAVELLVGGDGEAEGALDHRPDGGGLHVITDQSAQCGGPGLSLITVMDPSSPAGQSHISAVSLHVIVSQNNITKQLTTRCIWHSGALLNI